MNGARGEVRQPPVEGERASSTREPSPPAVSESYRLAVQLSDGVASIAFAIAQAESRGQVMQCADDLRDAARECEQLASLFNA